MALMYDYDAIVVGARCAGSATALLLARRGHRVLLLDRAAFPSDTVSGHALRVPGVARLHAWGLLDDLIATGCPPVTNFTYDVGPFALSGWSQPVGGASAMYVPRRYVLDTLLAHAAAAAGAELRERFTVTELLYDGEGVAGVRGASTGRAGLEARARIVIGADGLRSFVARAVGAPVAHAHAGTTCAYYAYWQDLPLPAGAEMYSREGAMVVLLPTHGGLTEVGVQWPVARFHEVRRDPEAALNATLRAIDPLLGERVRAARRVERFAGTGELPFFFRQAAGPGWALVGDAGCHKDPILAHGMSDALICAELLAGAIDDGLSGRRPLDEACAAYGRERDASMLPLYEFEHELAGLHLPPPPLQALLAGLLENPVATERFFSALDGSLPLADFFAASEPAPIGR
jgi:flavin-dependent dehydrogenase